MCVRERESETERERQTKREWESMCVCTLLASSDRRGRRNHILWVSTSSFSDSSKYKCQTATLNNACSSGERIFMPLFKINNVHAYIERFLYNMFKNWWIGPVVCYWYASLPLSHWRSGTELIERQSYTSSVLWFYFYVCLCVCFMSVDVYLCICVCVLCVCLCWFASALRAHGKRSE